jgi:hypothetical protein
MSDKEAELDQLQLAYKTAVDDWVTLIRAEEQLASVHHTVAQVDLWEGAHFAAEEARGKAEAAKSAYEDALRAHFYGI